jgi:hypothetical protein
MIAVSTTTASTEGASTASPSAPIESFLPTLSTVASGDPSGVSDGPIRVSPTLESRGTQVLDVRSQVSPALQSLELSQRPFFNSVIALQPKAPTNIAINRALRPIRILQLK